MGCLPERNNLLPASASVLVHTHSSKMGLLAIGTPLTWDEAFKYSDHVRTHGITQLLNIWNRYKSRSGDKLYWGDEVCLSYTRCVFTLASA